MKKLIFLGISSDIALYLANRFIDRGVEVHGTFRSRSAELDALEKRGAILTEVDVLSPESVKTFAAKFAAAGSGWDALISAVGTLAPIGPFFSLNFESWASSVETNAVAQLRVLHALYPMRDPSRPTKVILFAGGGTNGPFDFYSAYCVGKLNLIKMCELLHSEYADIHISIVGTGWVNTKIHAQTLAAGNAAGVNFGKTREFLDTAAARGTPLSDVGDCIDWCLTSPREAVSGRNFAVVHDPWRDATFINKLIADPDLCKLRRRQLDTPRVAS